MRTLLFVVGLASVLALAPVNRSAAQPPAGGVRPGPPGGLGQRQLPPRDARPGEAPRGTSIMRGVVVAADNGSPIRRAQVRVQGQGVGNRLATTDAQGRFEIRDLPAGRYTLSASKGGFVTLQYGQRRPSESGTPLELGNGETLDKLVIGLPRGSVIAGRVTDEFGEPVANAVVSALRYGYAGGAQRLMPASGQNGRDTTDDHGQFRLFGLPPGDYLVSASFRMGGGEAADPSGENTGYAPTYYPGTTSVGDAQRVTVGISQEQSHIIFSLIATRLVRVTGAVLNSQGAPVTNGNVILATAGARVGAPNTQLSGRIDGAGQFRIINVPPGRYIAQVRAFARRGGGGPAARLNAADAEFGRQEITVGADDLNGVVILTGPGARVTGQVVRDAGAGTAIDARQIAVMTRPAQLDPSLPTIGGNARVNDDFTFEVNGLFDPRVFRVNAPAGWTLKAVLLNGQDVTDTPLDIPPGQTVTGLQIVITDRLTEVSGTVTDARNRPVTDVTIVIFPSDEDKWTYQSRFIRAARPDQDGRFTIRGLPASADYLAVAVQGLEDGQAGDPEFLSTVRDRSAASFRLADGETRALDLRFAQQ